ncbi:hypothetical protein CBL_06227 [Carabus blaptoides fortunei]
MAETKEKNYYDPEDSLAVRTISLQSRCRSPYNHFTCRQHRIADTHTVSRPPYQTDNATAANRGHRLTFIGPSESLDMEKGQHQSRAKTTLPKLNEEQNKTT